MLNLHLEPGWEIITLKEALTRVHLEGLYHEGGFCENRHVVWTGYPIPFACGHYGKRGFGPLHEDKENDKKGKGRWYQEMCRVNQHFCSGAVLFNWACVAKDSQGHWYQIAMGACIVIDNPPDCELDTVLKLCFTG